jgi:hypothetical protein
MYLLDEQEEVERENRTWVAILGRGEMVKVVIPELVNDHPYPNTLHNAIWLFMCAAKKFNFVSYERMLNLDDVNPKEVTELLPTVEFDMELFVD